MKEAQTAIRLNRDIARQARFNKQMQDKMTVTTISRRLSMQQEI